MQEYREAVVRVTWLQTPSIGGVEVHIFRKNWITILRTHLLGRMRRHMVGLAIDVVFMER